MHRTTSTGIAARRRRRAVLLISAALSLCAWPGDPLTAGEPADDAIRLDVTRHVLDNGMTFLLVPFGDAPVVATIIRYKVGGVDDPKGMSGVAHLLEHMMFKGTRKLGTTDFEAESRLLEQLYDRQEQLDRERTRALEDGTEPDLELLSRLTEEIDRLRTEQDGFIVKNEIWQVYRRIGGTGLNATTGEDSTQYFVQIPSNQLEVWAWVESDRILNPVFREFYSERDVVHEERRMRVDASPRGLFQETLAAHSYLAHPYGQPVVGWSSDIDATEHDEVLRYFRTWYAPNNAVAALVGDLDVERTIELLERSFGAIPRQELPRRRMASEPPMRGEVRVTDRQEGRSQMSIAFRVPQSGHADQPALMVAQRILSGTGGGGRGSRGRRGTGRLSRNLVDELEVASRAFARVSFGRYPGLFTVGGSPGRRHTIEELEQGLGAELLRLADEPPTEQELTWVKNAVDAAAIRSLDSLSGIAAAISQAELLGGDWRRIELDRQRIKAVTAEDVSRVVRDYLLVPERVVGVVLGDQDGTGQVDDVAEEDE